MLRLKKFVYLVLALLITLSAMAVNTYAAEDTYASFNVTVTVKENEGLTAENYLIKRGIPIGDNVLKEDDSLEVFSKEDNRVIPAYTKVLETYESGYVKWVLVSFVRDITPYSTQNFILRKGAGDSDTSLKIDETPGNKVVIDNGVAIVTIDPMGINSIEYNGMNMLDEAGIKSFSEEYGKEKNLKTGGTIEVTERNPIYAEVKVSQLFSDNSAMRIEKVYTIVNESAAIACETRNISYNGPITYDDNNTCKHTVDSLYDKYYINQKLNNVKYSDMSMYRKNDPIYSCDYITAYSDEKGCGIAICSKDVDKFRGAVANLPEICNGFYYNDSESSVIFAPILYKKSYTEWIEGVSKTTHNDIVVYKDKKIEFDDLVKIRRNTPTVNIDKQQYIDAGLLASTDISALAQLQIDEIKWYRPHSGGRWIAGIIPYSLNSYKNVSSGHEVLLGESEYNTWFGAMVSGEQIVFDMAEEGTEAWSDNSVYRGRVEEARGAARSNYNKLNPANHPFYNEFSNCYIGYLLTGNNYFKDTVKLMADFFVRSAPYSLFGNGSKIALGVTWRYGAFRANEFDETRFNYSIRAMQNAYNLFKNKDYADIAKGISDWLAFCQEEEGFWYQFYDRDGEYFDLMKTPQPLCKDYIMLYSARGYKDYYDMTKDPVMLNTLTKFGDYLISEMGERGWMYSPCSRPEIDEMGEDGSRGKSPMQEIMSTEIFEMLYRETGDEKYFKALCTALRSYYSSCYKNGIAVMHFNEPQYASGNMNAVNGGQVLNVMRMDNVYCKLLRDNRELAHSLGFDDLLIAVTPGSKYMKEGIYSDYDDKEVTTTLIKAPDGQRVLFMGNNSGKNSGEWSKKLQIHIENAGIWTNTENRIESKLETVVGHYMNYFDYSSCIELPLRLASITGSGMTAADVTMNDREITFKVTADNGKYVLDIQDSEYNTVTISGDKTKTVSIKKGSGNDKVVVLDFDQGKFTYDIDNHWAKDDVLALINTGILNITDDEVKKLDDNTTLNEILLLAMRTIGVDDEDAVNKAIELNIISNSDIDRLNGIVTKEQATDIIYKALCTKVDENKIGVDINKFNTVRKINDDKEAVKCDSEYLKFDDNNVYADIRLPKNGPYGSEITYESSDSECISPNGMVNLPMTEDKEVTLTATFTRGQESTERDYTFVVHAAKNVSWNAAENFTTTHRIKNLNSDGNAFAIEATPQGDIVDVVFAFHSSENAVGSYGSFNLKFRFNSSGYIDAHNDTAYQSKDTVKYKKGVKYHFDIVVNAIAQTYSINVTDENNKTYTIADDFHFSSAAPYSNNLDQFQLIATDTAYGDSYANVSLFENAYAGTQENYGLDDAKTYWGICGDDVNISNKKGYKYFSSDDSVMDENGKYIGDPINDETLYIIGIPERYNMFYDYRQITDDMLLSVVKAYVIGLVKGNEENAFCPERVCSRAEAITLVNNLRQLVKHFNTAVEGK